MQIGDLYEAILDDEIYANLPAMAAELVGGRSGIIHHFDGNGGLVASHFSYYSADAMNAFAARFPDGRDIWTASGLASGIVNRPVPLDDLVPEIEFRASTLWNDVLRPHGDDTGHSIGLIHKLDGAVLGTSIHRPFVSGRFGQVETARFNALATDLHRIYRARLLLRRRDQKIANLEEMLEAEDVKTVLVGIDLRLIEFSPGAGMILTQADGMSIQNGRLYFPDAGLAKALRQAANATIHRRNVTQVTFTCLRASGVPPWRLLVLPSLNARISGCIVVIRDGATKPNRIRLWLRQYYGATQTEVVVAESLIAGQSPEEISAQRKVSINTIRTQVRRLLEKTGTHGITSLLLLLAQLS